MKKKLFLITVFLATMLVSCNSQQGKKDLSKNPFVHPSDLYLGAPDFNTIKFGDYEPAFEEGMRQHAEEIQAIIDNKEAPTFENTIVALEKSGQLLHRVSSVFFAMTSAHTSKELDALEAKLAPQLAEHSNKINLNDQLFQRIKAVYEGDQSTLDKEDKRILKVYYDDFVKAGALLSAEDKKHLADLNTQLASATTEFSQRLTVATATPLFFDKDELEGLPEAEMKAAEEVAKKENQKGKYGIYLANTTQQPILVNLKKEATRKKIFEASINRCQMGDKNDTKELVKKIALLRAEKAKLLGFPDYASWSLSDALAQKPDNVFAMLAKLANLSKSKVEADKNEIQAYARKTCGNDYELTAWDWNYYAEQLRKEKYGVDETLLNQYFQVDSVLINGVFYAAEKMYGLTFKKRDDIPTYQEDITVWEVFDKNGETLALFYFDPYSRPEKSGGAWMSNFVEQSYLLDQKPVIYNVCNNPKPAKGQPALISWDNVTTMFHEFGHALHGIFASQKYPKISGTNVPRDFVEMPSQFNEHAASDPEVFARYARHYLTQEVMPNDIKEKMLRAAEFNQAYPLAENIEASLIDMTIHTMGVDQINNIADVDQFQEETLKKYGVYYPSIPPRYGITYFRHIMSNGYAAGYYAYLWTEVLCHDVYKTMEKNGGLTRDNADRFRATILSKGNSEDLMKVFTDYTGHQEADINPLLEFRGLK